MVNCLRLSVVLLQCTSAMITISCYIIRNLQALHLFITLYTKAIPAVGVSKEYSTVFVMQFLYALLFKIFLQDLPGKRCTYLTAHRQTSVFKGGECETALFLRVQ